MRKLFTLFALVSAVTLKAQTHIPTNGLNFTPWAPYGYSAVPLYFQDSAHFTGKLRLKPFASLNAGYMFLGGNGGFSYISAPVGLALYKPINPNVTAFAAATFHPTVLNGNPLYSQQFGMSRTSVNLGTRFEGGLMYTNDARTFSISGSFSVERGGYPIYAPYAQPAVIRNK